MKVSTSDRETRPPNAAGAVGAAFAASADCARFAFHDPHRVQPQPEDLVQRRAAVLRRDRAGRLLAFVVERRITESRHCYSVRIKKELRPRKRENAK